MIQPDVSQLLNVVIRVSLTLIDLYLTTLLQPCFNRSIAKGNVSPWHQSWCNVTEVTIPDDEAKTQ
jgi:hypothetical protein